MAPKISVILPFRFPGEWFKAAVDSVFNQHHEPYELILINNNSDEPSVQMAHEFAAKEKRIRIIDESTAGIAFALNKGITAAKGELIARMDADDISLPCRFKTQLEFLQQNSDYGLVSGQVALPADRRNNEGMQFYVNEINELKSMNEIYGYRFVESPFSHPSVMFRKSLCDVHGNYTTRTDIPEDYELWLRWLSNGVKMGKVDEVILEWRDHTGRLSRNSNSYTRKAFDKVRMEYLIRDLQSNLRPGQAVLIWGGGKYSREKAKMLIRSGINITGFIDVNPERKIEGFSVCHYSEIPAPGKYYILSTVSNRGKHKEVRNFLEARNYIPERDFLISA